MMNTHRLAEAFRYAADLHKDQLRKGTSIPYVSHLMAVAATVLEHGGDEDQVIAALLHDAIEDQPRGGLTRQRIREQFGDRVLVLVEACTDSDTEQKADWRDRKEHYLEHLPTAPREAMRSVSPTLRVWTGARCAITSPLEMSLVKVSTLRSLQTSTH